MSTGFPNPPEYKGVYACQLNIINIDENDIDTIGIDQILRNLGKNPNSLDDVYLMVSNGTRRQVIRDGTYTVDNYANDTTVLIPNRLRSNKGTPFIEDWGQVTRALLPTGNAVVTGSVLRFKFEGTGINFCGFNHFHNYVKVTDFIGAHRSGQLAPPVGSVLLPKNKFLSYMQYEYDIPVAVDESRVQAIIDASARTSIPVEMEVYISYSMPLLKDYLTVSTLPGGGVGINLGELINTNALVDTLGAGENGQVLTWDGLEWTHQPPAGIGEVNTASNLIGGTGLFAQKNLSDLEFKSLVAGTNVGLVSDANTITINATDTGEANTASNLIGGTGLFAQKNLSDLEFKSLTSTGGNVAITNTANTVDLNVTFPVVAEQTRGWEYVYRTGTGDPASGEFTYGAFTLKIHKTDNNGIFRDFRLFGRIFSEFVFDDNNPTTNKHFRVSRQAGTVTDSGTFYTIGSIANAINTGLVDTDVLYLTIDDSGAVQLNDLEDVFTSGEANGDVLQYNFANSRYENTQLPAETTYTASLGVERIVNDFRADLRTQGGIVTNGNELQVDLAATDMVNELRAVDGGTGQSTYTVGDLLYADTPATLAKLPDVATGNVLKSGGVSTAPVYGKVDLTADVSGTLPATNGGTGQSSYTAGDLIYASGPTTLSTIPTTDNASKYLMGIVGGQPVWGQSSINDHTDVELSGTLFASPNVPPSGLTGATADPNYIVTQSSFFLNDPDFAGWQLFDDVVNTQNNSGIWCSAQPRYDSSSGGGNYTGSANLGIYNGEWVKLQLTTARTVTNYNIVVRDLFPDSTPSRWYLLGSNDDVSWTVVDDRTASPTPFTTWQTGVPIPATPSGTNYRLSFSATGTTGDFLYYALLVTNIQEGVHSVVGVCVNELELIATVGSNILETNQLLQFDGVNWVNTLKSNTTTTDPTVTDDTNQNYVVGSRWINTTTDKEYVCLDNAGAAAVWKETTVDTSTGHLLTYVGTATAGVGEFGLNPTTGNSTLTISNTSQTNPIAQLFQSAHTIFLAYNDSSNNGSYAAFKTNENSVVTDNTTYSSITNVSVINNTLTTNDVCRIIIKPPEFDQLDELIDVTITNPQPTNYLGYNDGTNEWVNRDIDLNELSTVTLGSGLFAPVTGDQLTYSAGNWTNLTNILGSMEFTGNVTPTTFGVSNTWTKLLGTYSLGSNTFLFQLGTGAPAPLNSLECLDGFSWQIEIKYFVTISSPTNNQDVSISVYKNGVIITESILESSLVNANRKMTATGIVWNTVTGGANDYFEIFIRNVNGTADVTADSSHLFINAIRLI